MYLPDSAYQAINEAGDLLQLKSRVQDALRLLSASDFMIRLEAQRSTGSAAPVIGTLPEAALQMLANRDMMATDPIHQQLAAASLPLPWWSDELAPCMLYQLLGQYGVRQGISMIHRGASAVSRIDFYSQSRHSFADTCNQQATFVLLGIHLHQRAEALQQQPKGAITVQLSRREKECIRWSAAGKTSAEIGLILGISERTTYFHLNNVAAKLNVYSTRHAISRAAELGLLD